MRKSIVIAIFGILLAGGLVYVLVDWGPNTIEYHVDAYRTEGNTSALEQWLEKRAPKLVELVYQRRLKRRKQHREALLRLGFLEQNAIVLSNACESAAMLTAVWNYAAGTNRNSEYFDWWVVTPATNVVRLVGRPREVQIWTDLIRQADVPESK